MASLHYVVAYLLSDRNAQLTLRSNRVDWQKRRIVSVSLKLNGGDGITGDTLVLCGGVKIGRWSEKAC